MKARLEKAYDLLSDDGVIFISIDDNMQAYLKIICDEVFGKDSFICCLPRKSSYGEKDAEPHINKHHDYIIVYCKNLSTIIDNNILDGDGRDISLFNNKDGDPRGP